MTGRRLLHTIVFLYLTITLLAFFFTMTRWPAFLGKIDAVYWSYGMMAPYQGDTSWNADLVAEGQLPDGSWEEISFDPYMPYGFPEQNVRKFLRVYKRMRTGMQKQKFTELALQLLDKERERGKQYAAVRFFFDRWDRSPAGYEFLHTPLFTEREFVTEVQ